jgi:hypothetical protein
LFFAITTKAWTFYHQHQSVHDKYYLALLINFELIVLFLTLTYRQNKRIFLLAATVFLVFGIVATRKALLGHSDCGCFGPFAIKPSAVAVVDFSLAFAFSISFVVGETKNEKNQVNAALLLISIVGCLGYFWISFARNIEPKNNQLKLVTRIDELDSRELELPTRSSSQVLNNGTWIVIFVRPGCPTCRKNLSRLCDSWSMNGSHSNIAIVEIVNDEVHAAYSNSEGATKFSLCESQLIDRVSVPLIYHISNGHIVSIHESVDALVQTRAHQW